MILAKQHIDETYFGIIYTIDDGDDWTDEKVWQKANPNWGISVKVDDFGNKARKAMQVTSAQNGFLTKHLNVWTNADTSWMNMLEWDKCGDSTLDENAFIGCDCHAALDLATKLDITALSFTFEKNGEFFEFHRYYTNQLAIEDGRNSSYDGWARAGRLIVTPGNVTDYGFIERDVLELHQKFKFISVAYDVYQSQYLANRLDEQGVPMWEYPQNVQTMSEPMKQLEALVLEHTFHHTHCPVFSWMASNVVAHVNAKEHIYPRKEFPENKIDGVIASIMCIGRHLIHNEKQLIPSIDVI